MNPPPHWSRGCERLQSVASLESLKVLRILSLRNTRISDASIEQLARYKSLEEVDVSCTQMSANGIKRLRELMPKTTIRQ